MKLTSGALTLVEAQSPKVNSLKKRFIQDMGAIKNLQEGCSEVTGVTLHYSAFLKLIENRIPILRVIFSNTALDKTMVWNVLMFKLERSY